MEPRGGDVDTGVYPLNRYSPTRALPLQSGTNHCDQSCPPFTPLAVVFAQYNPQQMLLQTTGLIISQLKNRQSRRSPHYHRTNPGRAQLPPSQPNPGYKTIHTLTRTSREEDHSAHRTTEPDARTQECRYAAPHPARACEDYVTGRHSTEISGWRSAFRALKGVHTEKGSTRGRQSVSTWRHNTRT